MQLHVSFFGSPSSRSSDTGERRRTASQESKTRGANGSSRNHVESAEDSAIIGKPHSHHLPSPTRWASRESGSPVSTFEADSIPIACEPETGSLSPGASAREPHLPESPEL
ncbi:hypothetical protein EJ06DRAFT_519465 [Trichodelitschia bisporula]|uniref:Uncharacterized protein n=1 Tax=Trichodelitschia bisporula TaxID=703511 RepID=A0A6G1I6J4_9PEZI|nr:hypothetical protein EJ06DRAFT_519465 [Trichodelitschia bisporula]